VQLRCQALSRAIWWEFLRDRPEVMPVVLGTAASKQQQAEGAAGQRDSPSQKLGRAPGQT
jgi:hypothetical protein